MGDIIGINGFFRALPVDYLAPWAIGGDRSGVAATGPHRTDLDLTDQVEFSDVGRRLSRTSDAAGLRPGRIARIRAAIDAGTYETPAKVSVVVDHLLDELG